MPKLRKHITQSTYKMFYDVITNGLRQRRLEVPRNLWADIAELPERATDEAVLALSDWLDKVPRPVRAQVLAAVRQKRYSGRGQSIHAVLSLEVGERLDLYQHENGLPSRGAAVAAALDVVDKVKREANHKKGGGLRTVVRHSEEFKAYVYELCEEHSRQWTYVARLLEDEGATNARGDVKWSGPSVRSIWTAYAKNHFEGVA